MKDETEISEIDAAPVSKELKKRWSYFIRKVYETDPLACPKCQGEMRIISFIDLSACNAQAGQPDVIKKILPVCCEHAQAGSTWVCGKSPMPRRITLQSERLHLTLHTRS